MRLRQQAEKPQILIVEDESKYIFGLARALKERGYSAVWARNSWEAARLLRTHKDSLQMILADVEINKPDKDHKYQDGFDWVMKEYSYFSTHKDCTFPRILFISGKEIIPDSHFGAISHPLRSNAPLQEAPLTMLPGIPKPRSMKKLSREEARAERRAFFDEVADTVEKYVSRESPARSAGLG